MELSSRQDTIRSSSSMEVSPEEEQERLSKDLALFLSNPSLRSALADGSLDLASYSSTIENELQVLEQQCIDVYRSKHKEICSLREELNACDSVLCSLQEMLLGFQADLGGLSGEIRNLQEKSRTLGVQLGNRKAAEEGLREFLSHIVVAPNLAHAICTGPIVGHDASGGKDVFLESVRTLNRIYHQVHSGEPQPWSADMPPRDTVAGREMQAHVTKLRLVAVKRSREYLLKAISQLRTPKTNVRILQVNALLKYSALQEFLEEANPTIAEEIYQVYIESMAKTLFALFRTYQAQLNPLDSSRQSGARQDVLAIDDAALRDVLTTKAKKRVDTFCLGTRAHDVLPASDQTTLPRPILAHVAQAEGIKYPYEVLYSSVLVHLLDAVTNEYVFCRQFFGRGDNAIHALFGRTLSHILEQLENYLFSCHDCLALLLMIKVTHAHKRVLHLRKISVLDGFLDKMTALLWPRLKTVMDSHLRSIKTANPRRLGGVDLHAHYVSRRYAEFTCSILLILNQSKHHHQHGRQGPDSHKGTDEETAADGGTATSTTTTATVATTRGAPVRHSSQGSLASISTTTTINNVSAGDMLLNDLATLLEETVLLLERLADDHSSPKKRAVFLINNLDQIICIFQERRVSGKELNRFVELLMKQRELFVEEELAENFSKMISFCQETEAAYLRASSSKGSQPNINAQTVESLARDFKLHWKSGIEEMNRNVLSYFSNFRNGMEILKQVLTQLLLYYTRFQDIIRRMWNNRPPPFAKDLVSTTIILTEIKKYALAI